MNNLKSAVWRWFEQKEITKDELGAALSLACEGKSNHPSKAQWYTLSEVLLTWLAMLLLGAGVIFFVAANWQSMSKMARFAMVESALIGSLLSYVVIRLQAIKRGDLHGFGYTTANAILLVAAIIMGSLLALVGQTYQTGADPWQLFALWALFTLPLAWVAGAELLWLLFGLLVNVALLLYYQTFPGMFAHLFLYDLALEALLVLNLLLHVCSLLLSGQLGLLAQRAVQLRRRYQTPIFQQLTILISITLVTVLAIESLFDWHSGFWLFVYALFIVAGFYIYNVLLKDIFVLAVGGFSLVAVINSLLIRIVLEGNEPIGLLLLLGLSIIGSTTAVTLWLKQRHKAFSLEGRSSC
ncbi:DUF2157 domain-containing protein [Shewanella sp. 125m-7]